MLAQHLITRPVFDALFEGYDFAEHNPVSQVMQAHARRPRRAALWTARPRRLEKFYDSVRMRAEGIDNAEGKQQIIAELYEKFFKTAFPKTADALGIVYTPVEIVDFILRCGRPRPARASSARVSDRRGCAHPRPASPAPAPSSSGCCSPV